MATILVGPDKKKFVVHQALLCSKSPYFTKALTGPFEEGQTGIVKLEDVTPALFRIIVIWLYTGKIVYTASNEDSNIDDELPSADGAFPSLECAKLLTQLPARIPENASTWPKMMLLPLYLLADRLGIKELRTNTIDALNDAISRTGRSMNTIDYRLIEYQTTATSPLRQFAVDHLVYGVKHSPTDLQFWKEISHGLTTEALLKMGQRIP